MNTDMAVVGAPSAGGDLGSSMPAPGPRGGVPTADVLFTLTAKSATLAAHKLTITGVADTTLFSTPSCQWCGPAQALYLHGSLFASFPLDCLLCSRTDFICDVWSDVWEILMCGKY